MVELDVCDDDSVRAAVDSVIAAAGRLDVLVNNAGTGLLVRVSGRGPPAGDPQEVADAIADLVELPAGTRPLRTTVGWGAQRADGLNDSAAELQRAVLERAGLLDVATLTQATEEV